MTLVMNLKACLNFRKALLIKKYFHQESYWCIKVCNDAFELYNPEIDDVPKLLDPFSKVGLASLVGTSDSVNLLFLDSLA
jgi:hypothetical protein